MNLSGVGHFHSAITLRWSHWRPRKRSEAAKGNDNAAKDRETVTEQPVLVLFSEAKPATENKARESKATASATNAGAVARGDKLATERPDLAEKVRMGTGADLRLCARESYADDAALGRLGKVSDGLRRPDVRKNAPLGVTPMDGGSAWGTGSV